MTQLNGNQTVCGILQLYNQNSGFLRDPERSFQPQFDDAYVSHQLIREYNITEGAVIRGLATIGEKRLQLIEVESICGMAPDQFETRSRFDKLVVINPNERIRLGDQGNPTMRIIDLVAPIGKGTRGMIVAQPKSGKTQMLEEMAAAIRVSEPDMRLIVLLLDERPEEVTHFQRNVDADVLASSSDQSIEQHVNLTELTLQHVRTELECGHHITVLVDSLTRMSRAFNQFGSGSKRTLSGGLDARALEIPRRFFGLARNIENGGSVTVIATILVNTGSRMDDYIFEEFKGTGNSEIVLDRILAESRVFPAIDIKASGTRRDELLYSEDEIRGLTLLRRKLINDEPIEAMRGMLKLMETFPNNTELLNKVNKED
ncbi:transcription termination factor Rho [bacterium]